MSTSIIKQSLKTSLVNYLGVILGAFFTVYLAPRYLTVEYNGLYRLLLEYAAIMAVYFNLGIPTVINKYYFQFFKEGAINRGFDFFVFIVPLILMGFGAVLFIFYRSEVVKLISSKEDYNFVYQYVLFLIPLIFSYAYFLILETYSAILGNIFVINFLKNIVVKLFNICSVICFIFTNDFFLSLYIVSFGTLLCILISFIYVLWLKKFKVNLLPSIAFLTGNKLLADFIKFTLFLAVSNLTYFLISKIDIYFVGRYTDLSNLAYYTTATFFVTIILVPYSAILNISFPKIAKVYFQQGIGEELKQMVKSNANFALAMATYIFLLVWINIDTIYSLIPNGELYRIGKYVFLILGIGKLVDISIGSIGQLLTVSRWYYITLVFSIFFSIISVVMGFYLTKIMGIYGTAFSSTICIIFLAFFQVLIVWQRMKVLPFSKGTLIIFCLIPLIMLFAAGIDMIINHSILSSLIKTLLCSMLFFCIMVKYNVSIEIKELLINIRNRIGYEKS